MSQVGVEDLLTRSSRQSCFRNPASQGRSPGFGAAGCIVRKVHPLDTTPVCCVQYGGVPVNIACYWPCTQDLYASLALTDNRRANSYSKRVQIGGLRVIFRSYAADGPYSATLMLTVYEDDRRSWTPSVPARAAICSKQRRFLYAIPSSFWTLRAQHFRHADSIQQNHRRMPPTGGPRRTRLRSQRAPPQGADPAASAIDSTTTRGNRPPASWLLDAQFPWLTGGFTRPRRALRRLPRAHLVAGPSLTKSSIQYALLPG